MHVTYRLGEPWLSVRTSSQSTCLFDMSLQRTLKYIKQGGFSKYWRDMQYIGDAKWGRMVGIDR